MASVLAAALMAANACDMNWNDDDDTEDIGCEFWDDQAKVTINDIAESFDISAEEDGAYLATMSWNLIPSTFAQVVDEELSDVTLTLRGTIRNSGSEETTYSISLSDSRYGDPIFIGSVTIGPGETYSIDGPNDFNEPADEVREAILDFIVNEPHNDWDYARISASGSGGGIDESTFALAISAGPMFWLHREGCGWYNDLDMPAGSYIDDAWLSGQIDNLSETDEVAVKIFTVNGDYGYGAPSLLDHFTIPPLTTVDMEDRSSHYTSGQEYEIIDMFLYDYDFILAMVGLHDVNMVVHDISANVEVIYPEYDYE